MESSLFLLGFHNSIHDKTFYVNKDTAKGILIRILVILILVVAVLGRVLRTVL